jgi:mono/diheme cytochrome c family protein
MWTWTTGSSCAALVLLVLSGQPARAEEAVTVEAGMKVYAAQKCGMCHSIEGKGSKKGVLDGVGTRLTGDEIRQWIVNATEMTKKTNATRKPLMKNYAHLPKADVDALVGYLQALKKI